jgi:hypothetical protein
MAHSTLKVSDFQFLRAARKLLPTSLLKEAVTATAKGPKRDRLLPAYLLLACLVHWFFDSAARLPNIVRWLCRCDEKVPSDPAIYKARARLGWAPMRWLVHRVCRALADPTQDPTAFYNGRRLLAIDGTTFTVADTEQNSKTFGRAKNQHGQSGYPLMRVVALCELGTHTLLHWVTRSFRVGEQTLAARLWRHITAGALVLADRNFHSYDLWEARKNSYDLGEAGKNRPWDLLIRVQSGPKFPISEVLPDGSYLSWVTPRRGKNKKARRIQVRVITYQYVDDKGKTHTSRLLTSLLDHTKDPASVLLELYHRRWEQELVFREIKKGLEDRVTQVRAQDPLLAMQELDGLLLGHYVLRTVILEAARKAKVAPVEISFEGTLRLISTRLRSFPEKAAAQQEWWEKFLKAVAREIVQKRRKRCCPRKKKVTRAAWPVKRKKDVETALPTLIVVKATMP